MALRRGLRRSRARSEATSIRLRVVGGDLVDRLNAQSQDLGGLAEQL